MTEKRKVKVQIKGIDFTLVGYDEERYLEALSRDLNSRIDRIMARNQKLSLVEAVILTSLNLEDDLQKEKMKSNEIIKSFEDGENAKKVELYEKNLEEIANLKNTLQEKEAMIKKLIDAEKFSSNKLKEESSKLREIFDKHKILETENADMTEKLKVTETKLASQEKLNFTNNQELAKLRKEAKMLREERAKLD